jgi:hypothetical protein
MSHIDNKIFLTISRKFETDKEINGRILVVIVLLDAYFLCSTL